MEPVANDPTHKPPRSYPRLDAGNRTGLTVAVCADRFHGPELMSLPRTRRCRKLQFRPARTTGLSGLVEHTVRQLVLNSRSWRQETGTCYYLRVLHIPEPRFPSRIGHLENTRRLDVRVNRLRPADAVGEDRAVR